MKKVRLLLFFVIIASTGYSQQFLWSTVENSSAKYVPIENVTNEVLEFFDHYQFYFDGAGYSKNSFLNAIEKYGDKSQSWKEFKQSILKIEKLTVFALRSNSGKGSVVLVMCVSKENVNFLSFSNNYESGSQTILPLESEKEKFSKWFQTLLK